MKKEPRCIHRHTIKEHPGCFKKGLVKPMQAREPKAFERDEEEVNHVEQWYEDPQYKIGFLDIESDNLVADFGTMLSWCIKEKDGRITEDAVTKKELFDGAGDRRIVKSLLDEMKKYKIIVTYFGTGFDIPYVRAKALHYGLDFPSFDSVETTTGRVKIEPEIYHFDLYYTVKSKLKISRKSLDNACDWLGIVGKTPIDKDVWRRAKYGDRKAILKVLEHNEGDVIILEELFNRLSPYRKWTRKGM